MKNPNVALVTGGTGFIGANLVDRLLKDDWIVHLIVRDKSNPKHLINIVEHNRLIIHAYNGTIDSMLKIVSQSKPTVVFHLASLFLAQHQPQDISKLIDSNVLFGTHLVEAMAINNVHKLVNVGTSWQHYESKEYNPVCLYAATKQAFESILAYYTEVSHLSVVTLKLFDTYGPNDLRGKLFSFLKNASNTSEPISMSPGEQLIDIVYIDDVINAFIRAFDLLCENSESKKYQSYAISSGSPIKLKELVSLYGKVINKELQIVWGGRPYREREVMTPWNTGDILPGWKPTVTLEEGIAKVTVG